MTPSDAFKVLHGSGLSRGVLWRLGRQAHLGGTSMTSTPEGASQTCADLEGQASGLGELVRNPLASKQARESVMLAL